MIWNYFSIVFLYDLGSAIHLDRKSASRMCRCYINLIKDDAWNKPEEERKEYGRRPRGIITDI
jgi:hypothetical protein